MIVATPGPTPGQAQDLPLLWTDAPRPASIVGAGLVPALGGGIDVTGRCLFTGDDESIKPAVPLLALMSFDADLIPIRSQ